MQDREKMKVVKKTTEELKINENNVSWIFKPLFPGAGKWEIMIMATRNKNGKKKVEKVKMTFVWIWNELRIVERETKKLKFHTTKWFWRPCWRIVKRPEMLMRIELDGDKEERERGKGNQLLASMTNFQLNFFLASQEKIKKINFCGKEREKKNECFVCVWMGGIKGKGGVAGVKSGSFGVKKECVLNLYLEKNKEFKKNTERKLMRRRRRGNTKRREKKVEICECGNWVLLKMFFFCFLFVHKAWKCKVEMKEQERK